MLLAGERFSGELTLGDTIFFAVVVGSFVLFALVVVIRGVIDEIRRRRG